MDETIDSLKIKIDVEVANGVENRIDSVSKSLTALKTTVNGFDIQDMYNFSKGLGILSDRLSSMSSKGLDTAVSSISNLTETLSVLTANSKDIAEKAPIISEALGQISSATKKFSGGLQGVRQVANAFSQLNTSTEALKDLKVPDNARENLEKFSVAMGDVSTKGTGFKNLVDGLKDAGTSFANFRKIKSENLVSTGESLRTFSDAVSNADFKMGTGLKSLATGLKDLTEIGKMDLSTLQGNLKTARTALQGFVKGLGKKISDEEVESFKKLATALESIAKFGGNFDKFAVGVKTLNGVKLSATKFDKVAETLVKLSDSLQGVDFKAGNGLKSLAQGLKELSKLGEGDIKHLVSNLTKARIALEQFIKDLGKDVTPEEMRRFKELSDALAKVTEGYIKLTAARNAYKKAPKGAREPKAPDEPATPKDGTQALMGNIAGSLGQLPFVGKFFGQITTSAHSMNAAFTAAAKSSGALGAALGPVAIGLAAVVAAVQGVQKYIQFVNDQFNKMVSTLSKVAGTVKDVAVGSFEYLKGKLEGIGKTIEGFAKGIADAVKNISSFGKSVSKTFDKFSGSFFKNVEKGFKSLVNMVKRMALRKAINAIFKDINDSFENLVAFSRKYGTEFADSMDMFATSAKYLNNSIVAMVSPIINMVMPVFDKLVDKVVELMNAFNQLFTYFSGANEWTKAIKNAKKYGEEAEKSSKKQKKLNNAILSFDEIHKLNGDNGKGKDFSTSDFEDWVFEIKTLDDLFDYLNEKLKGFLSNVKDYLDGIDWRQIKGVAYDLGEGIMKLLNSIFGDEGLAVRLGKSLAEVINTAFTFALGAVEEWDAQAWGRSFVAFFEGLFDNLDWTVIRMTFEEFGTKLAEYLNTIFDAEALFGKFGDAVAKGFNSVLAGVSNFVKDINLKQFGKDLGIAFEAAFSNIDYNDLFVTLATLINKVFDAVAAWVSESDLPEIATKIGDGLTEGLKTLDWVSIKQGVFGLVESLDEAINNLFSDSVLMSKAGETLAQAFNTIKGAIVRFWDGLDAEKVGAGLGNFIDSFLDTRNLEGVLIHLTEFPQKILSIIANAFSNIETKDLGRRIGEGITKAIENINLEQIGSNLSTIGTKIGEFFGELFDNVNFKDLGKKASGLAKKLIAAIADMLNEVNWRELGSDLADGFNTMMEDFFGDENNVENAQSIIKDITRFVRTLINKIHWEEIWEDIDTFMDALPLEELWASITQLTIRFWETKRELVRSWISAKIKGIFDGAVEEVKAWFGNKSIFDIIADALLYVNPTTHFAQNPISQELLSYLGLDNESLKEAFLHIFDGIEIDTTALKNIVGGADGLSEFSLSIGDSFENLIPKIKEMAGSIKNILQPAIDGVKSVFDSIKSIVDKIYNKLKDWVTKIEDLISPLEEVSDFFSTTSESISGTFSAPHTGKKPSRKHATGMQGGVILNRGTVFGMDGDTRLVGGEAGKEAVVGVGSLSTMIQSSVLGAMSPMSMSTAVEAGVRSAMQGGGSSPVVDVTLKCDSETLFRMVKQGQTAYNGRYHFVEDFA